MKKITLLMLTLALALTGCQLFYGPQPHAALYASPAPIPTPPTQPSITPQPTATQGSADCVVTVKALNLRAGPGTAYNVTAWLMAGEALTLTGKTRGAWVEVETTQDARGWIHSNYCEGK